MTNPDVEICHGCGSYSWAIDRRRHRWHCSECGASETDTEYFDSISDKLAIEGTVNGFATKLGIGCGYADAEFGMDRKNDGVHFTYIKPVGGFSYKDSTGMELYVQADYGKNPGEIEFHYYPLGSEELTKKEEITSIVSEFDKKSFEQKYTVLCEMLLEEGNNIIDEED